MKISAKRTTSAPEAHAWNIRSWRLLVLINAIASYVLAVAVSINASPYPSVLAPSLVLCLLNVYTYFYNGQESLVATSSLSYGILVFVTFPAIYTDLDSYTSLKSPTDEGRLLALTLGFILQALLLIAAPGKTTALVESRSDTRPSLIPNFSGGRRSLALPLITFGLSLALASSPLSLVSHALSWLAMLLAADSVLKFRGGARIIALTLAVAMFLVLFGSSLGNFGRLNIAIIVVSVVMLISVRTSNWRAKIFLLLITGPGLILLSALRLQYLNEDLGRSADGTEGIGSVIGPFQSAALLIDASSAGQIDLALGGTVLVAALSWIPRALWTSKPDGFGREIVEITQPWLVSVTEHSDAATIIGEAVWNFGVWGAPIFLLAIVLLARLVDKAIFRLKTTRDELNSTFYLLICMVLGASFLNVVWGGMFTAVTRTLIPVAILFILHLITKSRPSTKGESNKTEQQKQTIGNN